MQPNNNEIQPGTNPSCSSSSAPMNSLHHQIQPHDLEDDFLDQMLSNLPSFWDNQLNPSDDNNNNNTNNVNNSVSDFHYDGDHKLSNHQIPPPSTAALMLQRQLLHQMPLTIGNDVVDGSSFNRSHIPGGDASVQSLFNGLAGSMHDAHQSQHFHNPQGQNFGAAPAANGAAVNEAPAQPKQRVRARRGQATDPHSIAERLRRERIAERMKALQELVPNANKTDKASMLDEIIDYVKFLQLQVKVLSMSRLGGGAAVAPLVADISSEGGGGDCSQQAAAAGTSTGNQAASSSNDTVTMTEHQVAKLMEEDMGSAMQYLQGKGLCLMPISLATAISTATCATRNPVTAANGSGREGPSSPSMSVLTVQSATVANDGAVKDATSVSKP